MDERKAILIGGKPGSGKSRLSNNLVENLRPYTPSEHVSIGNTIRQIAQGAIKSVYTEQIRQHLLSTRTFDPLDDEIIFNVVDDRLSHHNEVDLLLIDGFPRYQSQIEMTYELATLHGRTISGLLITDIADVYAVGRMIKRSPRDYQPQVMVSQAWNRLTIHADHYTAVEQELAITRHLPTQTIDTSGDKGETDRIGLGAVLRMLHLPPQ